MDFIIIFGPPAVGKMTVGVELAKISGLKLFHNHMTIDLVLNFFDWESPQFKLSNEIRQRIFEEVATSDLDGLIFTFVWALNDDRDKTYIDNICSIFRAQGANIHFVELYSDVSTRLQRNVTEFRLQQKPTKKDTEHSTKNILKWEDKYKMNSENDFFYPESHLRIDNTNLSATEAAYKIAKHFKLH